ncbi:MAG: NAD(P)H-hydrate dehydratase [Bacteroidales bacterium]|jgi:NAD(P)H-hydrate epimerase|nr:NAD(P)H-hydrate dehydratase [Bacteroidales bacterium]
MILTVEETRLVEKLTQKKEGISSNDLMKRAASGFAEQLLKQFPLQKSSTIAFFCGGGKNGGDGIYAANIFANEGFNVFVGLCYPDEQCSKETGEALKELRKSTLPNLTIVENAIDIFSSLPQDAILVDALLGTGLDRPLESPVVEIVQKINKSGRKVIALDIPTGLFADKHTPFTNVKVKATRTFAMQYRKPAFLVPENASTTGEVSFVDIGLSPEVGMQTTYTEITRELVRGLLTAPKRFAHKGAQGNGLLIAGSANMPGAAILAVKSALRGGLGKLTLHAPKSVIDHLPSVAPETILSVDANKYTFSKVEPYRLNYLNGLAIGPGMGKSTATVAAVDSLLNEYKAPAIFDADALNILSDNKEWLDRLTEYSILTPHFKEFERLTGKAENDFERLDNLSRFAKRYAVIVVLKGAYSAIAMPDGKLFFNTTGNPGMATAGSGDVLTGLLLALLTRGFTPPSVAIVGTYLHGLAGDLALQQAGAPDSVIASDLCNFFGKAFQQARE